MEQQNVIPHSDAVQYILAGKSTVGFHSEKTGNTFWFYVSRNKYVESWNVYLTFDSQEQDRLILRIDNKRNLTVLGFVPKFSPLKKEHLAAFDHTWTHLLKGNLDPRVKILHKGECGYCNRPLTDAESLKKGIGPICRKKLGIP